MASFIESSLRLLFRRKPRQGELRPDVESAATTAAPAPAPSTTSAPLSSTVGANSSTQHLHTRSFGGGNGNDGGHHHQGVVIPSDDPLTMFRLMLGITDAPRLGFAEKNPIGTRPASNIGIYARVVHSEQKSKDSFKVSDPDCAFVSLQKLTRMCFFPGLGLLDCHQRLLLPADHRRRFLDSDGRRWVE